MDFIQKLKIYSTFDKDIICDLLVSIINFIEKDEYVYTYSIYQKKVQFDFYSNPIRVDLITRKDEYKSYYVEYYRKPFLNIIKRDENTIIISFKQDSSNNMQFYTLENYKIYKNINFKRFTYLDDFMSELIEYRFKNKLIDITLQELIEYKDNFLEKYKNKLNIL